MRVRTPGAPGRDQGFCAADHLDEQGIPEGIKFGDPPADYEKVTNGTAKTTLDRDTETAIVGKLFDRVMDHIPAQYERQGGRCAVCGRVLPTVADGLLRLAGDLECITCHLTRHDS